MADAFIYFTKQGKKKQEKAKRKNEREVRSKGILSLHSHPSLQGGHCQMTPHASYCTYHTHTHLLEWNSHAERPLSSRMCWPHVWRPSSERRVGPHWMRPVEWFIQGLIHSPGSKKEAVGTQTWPRQCEWDSGTLNIDWLNSDDCC